MLNLIKNSILFALFCISVSIIQASTGDTETYGDLTYLEEESSITIIDCDLNAVSVVIPETIADKAVTRIESEAFFLCTHLAEITIPDSVTSIGESAFYECSSLTEITIPGPVKNIELGTFYACYNLIKVSLPDSVTIIGDWAFSFCYELIEINFPNSLTSIGKFAFWQDIKLIQITIPASLSTIGQDAFEGLYSQNDKEFLFLGNAPSGTYTFHGDNIDIYYHTDESGFNNSDLSQHNLIKVKNEEAILELVHPGLGTYGDLSYYEYSDEISIVDCDPEVTSINIPDSISNKPVSSIGVTAFRNSKLTQITLPNTITSIDYAAFSECSNLNEIILPESITKIDSAAFYECTALTEIIIPNSVTRLGDFSVFSYCDNLSKIKLSSSLTSIGIETFGFSSSFSKITIPESVTYIESGAFYECPNFNEIYFNGNAPDISSGDPFYKVDESITVYYYSDRTGFDAAEWAEYDLVELEPFIWRDAEENDAGNVLTSDWYDWFYIDDYPVIYHPKHGYQYCYEDSSDSLYLWDYATEKWFWTHRDSYPWVYIFTDSPRYYYFSEDGTAGKRWFSDSITGEWIFETDI